MSVTTIGGGDVSVEQEVESILPTMLSLSWTEATAYLDDKLNMPDRDVSRYVHVLYSVAVQIVYDLSSNQVINPDSLVSVMREIDEVYNRVKYYEYLARFGDDRKARLSMKLDRIHINSLAVQDRRTLSDCVVNAVHNAFCGEKTVFSDDQTNLNGKLNFAVGSISTGIANHFGIPIGAVAALVIAMMLFAAKIGLTAFCMWLSALVRGEYEDEFDVLVDENGVSIDIDAVPTGEDDGHDGDDEDGPSKQGFETLSPNT